MTVSLGLRLEWEKGNIIPPKVFFYLFWDIRSFQIFDLAFPSKIESNRQILYAFCLQNEIALPRHHLTLYALSVF